MSAVDRATTTTTTSITSRTGLEGPRQQAWPGTVKEKNNGNTIHGQPFREFPALALLFYLGMGKARFFFYDVTNDGITARCLLRGGGGLASCF